MLKKPDAILGEALVESGLLTRQRLEAILKEVDTANFTLCQTLIEKGLIKEKEAVEIVSKKMGIKFVNLKELSIDKSLVDKVKVALVSYYKFMPIKIEGNVLTIACFWPLDLKVQDEIRTHLGYAYDLEIVLALRTDIMDMLHKFYGLAADIMEKIMLQAKAAESVGSIQESNQEVENIDKLAQDASVINLVNQIILEAFRKRATDIHIEPYRGGVSLRYRIDGMLFDADAPQQIKYFLLPIISRIKIMSNLNIVERRLPQDGRSVVRIQDQVLDLRISTLPTPYGEGVVIRILPSQMLFGLEKLGLEPKEITVLEELIQRPYGIIFVTGPTGSGKTTTLYACLSKLNTRERKIITIEDPIEYEIKGVTQIQVMPEIGLDFSRGLRSMLRHDPDVMMVGEVRDAETAEIAIRVALTGHLVFSTLHTNDAASGITRLVDIGIEPYLVASSVEIFIAQRLIRVICPHCKYEDTTLLPELRRQIAEGLGLDSHSKVKIFRGKGCAECNYSGFFGRTAIYEMLFIDAVIEDMITRSATAQEIKNEAVKQGMRTLRQSGWQKVIDGFTTPEEVMKVTPSEDHHLKKTQVFVEVAGQEEKETGSERRVFQRLDSRVNIRYKIFNSEAELLRHGYTPERITATKNIGAGGLLFASPENIALGAFLDLVIEIPDSNVPVTCLAKVLRSEEVSSGSRYDVGVCFMGLSGVERQRINKFVEEE